MPVLRIIILHACSWQMHMPKVARMSGDAGRFFIAVVGKHHAVPGT